MKKAVTCGSIIEDIKNEGRAEGRAEATDEARAEGRAEGRVEASLNILNVLVTDPDFNLSLDLLVEKFGFTPEQILNGK
ncbi:MAG: hypothetical protein E7Z73_00550 [Methanobrevibacter millerae]|uniref:Uncharacterized protein n=1 Tax=Methanobrevibacter millerae TaxID=230361 RepID=A0A8T3VHR0_9EURY|nr:hypothetical protein [Methanobrevibacter millerae]